MESARDLESRLGLSEKKRAAYETLCEGVPDAISILARGLETVERDGEIVRTKTTGYQSTEIHGNVSGSRAGVLAAIELSKYFPEANLIANSFVHRTDEHHARVIATELERAGVQPDRIIIQEDSFSTYSELLELIRLVTQHEWRHAVVVVNEFVVPRAKAFIRHIHDVGDPAGYRERPGIAEVLQKYEEMRRAGSACITVVSSEEIVSRIDPRYRRLIEEARKLPQWQTTTERELSATRAIDDGMYGKDPPPTFVKQ